MRYTSSANPSMDEAEFLEYWEESFEDYDGFTPREHIRLDDHFDLAKILNEMRTGAYGKKTERLKYAS